MKSIYHPNYEIFIDYLKTVRIQAGLTQIELGTKIGMDQTYVSKYENRERRIDLLELRTICNALGISLIDFVINLEAKLISNQ